MSRGWFRKREFVDITMEQPCSKCKSLTSREKRRGMENSLQVLHKSDGAREPPFAYEAQHEYFFFPA